MPEKTEEETPTMVPRVTEIKTTRKPMESEREGIVHTDSEVGLDDVCFSRCKDGEGIDHFGTFKINGFCFCSRARHA